MFFAILHNIRSLHNVGAIFRAADGAGVFKIYLCGYTGTPPRKEITKVALGAEDAVPWEYLRRPGDVMRRLRAQGVRIVALEVSDRSVDIQHYRPQFPMALLVGNEVRGIPKALLAKCDDVLAIPMRGMKESLNVSVAFGVAAYTLTEQKRKK